MSIKTISMNATAFVMSKSFPIVSETIGIYGCFSLMSGACILGIVFVIFVMEETNGRNLDLIGNATSQPETTATVPNKNTV